MKLKHNLFTKTLLLLVVFLSYVSAGLSQDVNVITFNVRVPVDPAPNDWNSRKPRVLSIINNYTPDFFGVQEAVPSVVSDIDNGLANYSSLGRGRDADGGGEGSQIFYRNDRWNVDWTDQGTFQLSPTPEIPGSNGWGFQWVRICTWARMIEKSTGKAVYIFNTHFPLAPNERSLCAQLVASRIAGRKQKSEPVILTGDFNACEGEASMNYFLGQGGSPIAMKDSYRVLYPSAIAGTFHGFSGNAGACKIDYVYTMGESNVLEAAIIKDQSSGGYPSDHFVVRGKMRFGGTPIDCSIRSPYGNTPISLPGKIEVENYDKGCINVTYFDKSNGNSGNTYRTDEVDIETCAEGGFNLGWTEDGEWLEYTVNIPSGLYTLDARVAGANTTNGSIHLELEGAALGTPLTFTPTGAWQTWKTVSTATFEVTNGGTKKLRLFIDKGGFNLNSITLNAVQTRIPYTGSAIVLPGKIEAENYDKGPSGLVYSDVSPTNIGGVYRSEAVDIETCTEGGFDVGWTEDGEWMEYSVLISPGKYTADFRSASALTTNGTLHAELDGINVTGPVSLPTTGGWQVWKTTSSKEFTVSGTTQKILRVFVEKGGFNLNSISFTLIPVIVRTPYNGTAAVIPGIIQAENFDVGASGVVYKDAETANQGAVYRNTEVDIEACAEGGYNVGWTNPSEWLEYSIAVSSNDLYSASFRTAGNSAGIIHLELDGVNITGPITIPATGGWQTWTSTTKSGIALTAGNHILRVYIDQAGFNLNSITFTKGGSSFLRRNGKLIVNDQGNYLIKAMNLGNWMVQEGYMLNMTGDNNISYAYQFKNNLDALVGVSRRQQFFKDYLQNYYTKSDIDSLSKWGFNTVRLPMHYNLLVSLTNPDVYNESGFAMVDSVIGWCKAKKMYVILDLHAAPGGQSSGDISDYITGQPSLWESAANRDKTIRLWRKLAERYANETTVGAYDLINETNWTIAGNGLLLQLMKDITTSIRQVDNQHLLFVEGNGYANDFTNMTPPWDSNMAYSFHKYWSYNDEASLNFVKTIRDAHNIPIWLGEYGENSNQWMYEATRLLEQNNIGWAVWPMKKMASVSGIVSFKEPALWSKVVDYWKGIGSKPTANEVESVLAEMIENIKINNCVVNYGYLRSLMEPLATTIAFSKQSIPGKVMACHYDEGNNGVAYNDATFQTLQVSTGTYTSWNNGWTFRNDGVDIEYSTSEANPVIAWTENGDWTNYTVEVNQTGSYQVYARVAGNGGKLSLSSDMTSLLNAVDVTATGGWNNYQTVLLGTISLNAGKQVLRMTIAAGGYNIHYLNFSPAAPAAPIATTSGLATSLTVYPNPMGEASLLNLSLPVEEGETNLTITVLNSMGSRVLEKNIERSGTLFSGTLDFSSLPHGQYTLMSTTNVRTKNVLIIY